jgi:hypothetical protein
MTALCKERAIMEFVVATVGKALFLNCFHNHLFH